MPTSSRSGDLTNNVTDKRALRNALRQRRRGIPATAQKKAALALLDAVVELPQWNGARRIALYTAFDGEVDPTPIAESALASGKTVCLPVVGPDTTLQFRDWDGQQALEQNRYGIAQPLDGAPDVMGSIDIIFLPLVAFDLNGNRLGMGKGYYDRALAKARQVTRVGLAHTCQQVERLTPESWDVPLDYIATDTALHRVEQ